MTIMVESSRSFLFTEYARTGCGTFKNQGTDPRVWDALPVSLVMLDLMLRFDDIYMLIPAGQVLFVSQYPGDSAPGQGR